MSAIIAGREDDAAIKTMISALSDGFRKKIVIRKLFCVPKSKRLMK